MAPRAPRALTPAFAAAALDEAAMPPADAQPPPSGGAWVGPGATRLAISGKRARREGEDSPAERHADGAQLNKDYLPAQKLPKGADNRPSVVGGEASVPTEKLYWLRASLDQDTELTEAQKQAVAMITPGDIFATLLLAMLEGGEGTNDAPQAFAQTDPDDGDASAERAASLRVALSKPEHATALRTHTKGVLYVAPSDMADEADAYVPYTIKQTSNAPAMARALREQNGVWIEVFTRGAPVAYNKEHIKHAIITQIRGASIISIRQPVGLKTNEGASMAKVTGVKPKFVLTLDKPEGAVHRLPATLILPGDWPATYRVQPDAFPHLCAKCHQPKGKGGSCLCTAAKAKLDRAGGSGFGRGRSGGRGGVSKRARAR